MVAPVGEDGRVRHVINIDEQLIKRSELEVNRHSVVEVL